MAKFLPPETKGVTYAIQNNAQTTFQSEAASFMKEIAQKMAVEAVNDTGRIPSLMSRAYNFYIDLFPENFAGGEADLGTGRDVAHKRARRAFRGIVSLLALRDAMGLEIKLKKFPEDAQRAADENPYRTVFMESYGESPEFGKPANVDQDEHDAGDGQGGNGNNAWRQLRYLVVRTPIRKTPDGKDEAGRDRFKVDYSEEPLCGLSPFTLFFPAGTPLKQCNNIFWYKQTFDEQGKLAGGEWLDPTTDWTNDPNERMHVRVNYEVIKTIRGYMVRWLDLVLQGSTETIWKSFGLRGRAKMIEDELSAWLGELRTKDCAAEPKQLRVETASLQFNLISQGQMVGVPVLEQKIGWDAGGVGGIKFPGLVSELPRVGNRVLLSDEILRKHGLRICGGLMGNGSLPASLKSLPPEGDGFVVYNGDRSYYIPESYVIVDRLFLDNLHLVADGPLANQFYAIKTEGSGDEMWWLLPFRPELMSYLDLESLRRRDSGLIKCVRAGGTGDNYMEVSLTLGGETFRRRYPWNSLNRDMAGNALDLRIWPNFRFSTAPKLPSQDVDRVHYFRIRQQEVWDLHTQILARPAKVAGEAASAVRAFPVKAWDDGWPDTLEPLHFRSSRCYAFPSKEANAPGTEGNGGKEWEPVGLVFEGRGICLFRLEEPAAVTQGNAAKWRIGIDFGTSNTCVAFTVDAAGVVGTPQEIRFEMQTMSLQANPKYERVDDLLARGQYTEGPAAVLDFPYKYADETHVTEAAYFPTQWLTRLPEGAEPNNTKFFMSNGLIFARNLLDFKDIVQLLNDYPPSPEADHRPFHVVPDPKWKYQIYRPAFLRHLYRMLVYHASRRGAKITSAAFSFPRAFLKKDVDRYRNELNTIFQDEGGVPASGMALITESEAVQNLLTSVEVSESPLVLDVGGGTTDLLGIFQQKRFQASYKFAAGLVNKYFTASPPLQHMFEEALWKVIKEEDKGTRLGDQQADRKKLLKDLFSNQGGGLREVRTDYIQQGFFRILGMLEDRHYPSLVDELQRLGEGAQNQANRKALAGFFHTLVLLYAGMVYQAGRLMRQQNIGANNIKVRLIGNGSRFYRFLSHRNSDFDKVLKGMLLASYKQQPEFKVVLDPEGKALVAKGLLAPSQGNRAEVTPDTESHDYLLKLSEQPTTLPTPEQFDKLMGPDLVPFLEALNRELPSGQLDASTVIPYCEPNLLNEMRRLFVSIPTAVFSREIDNAKSLKEDWFKAEELAKTSETAAIPHRESALATEPVFVIRLKCLIEKIRDNYANLK